MYEVTEQEMVAKLEELKAKNGPFNRSLDYKNFKSGPVPDIAYFVAIAISFELSEMISWGTAEPQDGYTKCPAQMLHEVIVPNFPQEEGAMFTIYDPETMHYSEYFVRIKYKT